MPEPLPTSVGTPTKRSGAIYNSADLFYKLIEEETLHAIKPYQDALQKLSCQLADARAARQAPDTRDTVTVTQANLIAQQVRDQAMNELDELKDTLTENGLGVTWASGRKTLRFVGERAKITSNLDEQVKRYAPDSTSYSPISPSSIVDVLVQCLTIGAKSLKETEDKYAAALKERDQLNRALTKRKDETQAEASRWGVQREHLSAKIVALTEEVESLRKEAQTFSIRMISVRVESDDWKEKYLAADVERASLQTRIDETEGKPKLAREEVEIWKKKCDAAEAERDSLKTNLNECDRKLASVQAEVDTWKNKYVVAEAEQDSFKTKMDESSDKLASTQAEVEDWKAKYLAIQSRVDENERKLSLAEAEVGAWKAKSAAADASRDVAESSLHSANATISQNSDKAKTDTQQWIAKAAAWDTERTRLKAANAHNAKGITQLRIDATRLKGQHRDVVQERDQLKNSFEADNAKSLATLGALTAEVEDLKKKLSAALSSPKPPTGMFINNKARTIAPPSRSLPNKPETETPAPNKNTPRIPESTAAVPMGATPRRSFNQPNPAANPSPDQPSSEADSSLKTQSKPDSAANVPVTGEPASQAQPVRQVVALQAGVSVRRNVSSPTSPSRVTQARRPSAEGLGGSPVVAQSQPTGVRKDANSELRSSSSLGSNPTGSFQVLQGAQPLTRRADATSAGKSNAVRRASESVRKSPTVGVSIPAQFSKSRPSQPTKVVAEDSVSSPSLAKRPSLSSNSQSNAPMVPPPLLQSPKLPADASAPSSSTVSSNAPKRPAPSPLVSDRAKVPRISSDSISSPHTTRFTRPPTAITVPVRPRRAPVPPEPTQDPRSHNPPAAQHPPLRSRKPAQAPQ